MSKASIKEILDKEMSFIELNEEEGWVKLQGKMKESIKTGRAAHWHVSGTAATAAGMLLAVLIPVGSVLAYGYYQHIYRLPNIEQRIVVGDIPLENNITVVQEEACLSMDNLQIEWMGQRLDEDGVVMTFRLKTKDGSPLITDKPNKAPLLFPLSFEKVQVTVNGVSRQFSGIYEPYEYLPEDYYIGCTAIAENYSCADFELSIRDETLQLQGQEVCIQLDNLVGTYHTFTDLKTAGTLGDILEQSAEGENLHIAFSEEYPKCYIDSYGFEADTIYENPKNILHIFPHGKKMFTMTVVCDDESRDIIRNMVFQNIDTGFNGTAEMQVKELEDGRLRFFYSVNYDGSYVDETYHARGGEPRDTTMEDLQKLVLKLNGERITEKVMDGTIEEKIVLE